MKQAPQTETLHFRRVQTEGVIQVVNQNSYVMAEYLQRTGRTTWHRLLPINQRTAVEKRLADQFPVGTKKTANKS